MSELSTEQHIVIALRRIIRAVDRHSKVLAQKFGLTGPQILVLQEIVRMDTVAIGDLADRVHLSQGTVSEILDRLADRGLVNRERSTEDRRRVDCSATAEAKALLARRPSLLQDRFVTKLMELPEWERTSMLSSLQRVAEMMGAEDDDAGPVLTSGPAIEFLSKKKP